MERDGAPVTSTSNVGTDRIPPYSDEAEQGVLGSILLDSVRVMDLCIDRGLIPESFYVPAHRLLYETMEEMARAATVIDVVTITERLRAADRLDRIGGTVVIDRLVDSTPTAAHAEYYIDIVRQKDLLRRIIDCARKSEQECYSSEESADLILGRAEQAFLDISERRQGNMVPWPDAVDETMGHIAKMLSDKSGLTGLSTGLLNLDKKLHGLRQSEMIVLAARPSMGKTSLAMNIAENIALGV